MSHLTSAKNFLLPKLRQILNFFARQGLAIAGNMLYGLLCVRLLPVPEYAKFAVLFGFMGTLTILLDAATMSTLAPLVGEEIGNLPLIADYIASARQIALRMFLVVGPAAGICFLFLVRKQHWGAVTNSEMVIVLLIIAWFARVSSSYGSVLLLRRDRNQYYRAQIIGSLGSLSLLIILALCHALTIYAAIGLNMLQIIFIAVSYFRRARQLLGIKGQPNPKFEKAIIRLAMPNIPGTIFYAIQGQVTLLLITLFGHSSSSIADVGALNRLGQIFSIFVQMNPILVEPFFARLPVHRLKKAYLAAIAITVALLACFSAAAFRFPEIFLWILGPHYSQLRVEVGLVILATSINFLAGFLFIIHTSRRFVFWWSNLLNILIILLVQAGFLWKSDLSTVQNVLKMTIGTALSSLLVNSATGAYGFWRGPRKVD